MSSTSSINIIQSYFDDLSDKQCQQFRALKKLYNEWNEKINIISRKDIDALYEKHVLHSLSIAAIVNFKSSTHIIDIGTGGGFPGIPLSIFFPNTSFYLIDSIGKKIKVVNAVKDALQLENITAEQVRAESIHDKKYDFVVSRAVAPLGELWKWSKPLLKRGNELELPNGLICLKGGDLHQEIAESGCRPCLIELQKIFQEDYFKEKYLLHVKV